MDATAGRWLADARLVRRAVNVNVASARIHIATAVEARFETFQPENAAGDFGVRKFRLRGVADGFARFENRSRRCASADFFRDSMQSQRRAIRAFRLPDAETRGGAGKFFDEFIFLEQRNSLPGDVDGENELRWRNF